MNARLLLNLGLLALLMALGWFALQMDSPAPEPPSVALTSLSVDHINTIQIDRDGSTVARLQRSAGLWHVQMPIIAAADNFRVQALLGLARARSSVGFRATGNDLRQFGLQPARATVRFDSTTMLIGDTDPIAGHRYVMVDDQVHLLEDKWFAQIFGGGVAWLDPRPLPAGATLLRIDLPAGPRNARRQTPGQAAGQAAGQATDQATDDPSAAPVQWQHVDDRWLRTPADPAANAQLSDRRGSALADAWRQARALSVRRRDPKLDWNQQILIAFKAAQPPAEQAQHARDAQTRQLADVEVDEVKTIVFKVARTADALFLARDDLGVQYRFLVRQGNALLGATAMP